MRYVDNVNLGIANYYGEIQIYLDSETNKYYMGLENWNGISEKEISKGLYDLLKNELGGKKENGKR